MKKGKMSLLLAIMAVAALLTACGSKEYLKDLNASKYVTLGEYKGVAVEIDTVKVEDADVESALEYILSSAMTTQEVTGRAVQEGDVVSIDFAGYKDGVAFDGGTGSKDLEIGSHTFIDGFESGLIGYKVGDHVALNLTFPENYQSAELAGQAVVFEVDINKISEKVLPELNDEFVTNLGMDDLKTVDDLKKYVYDLLLQDEQEAYNNELKASITEAVVKNCEFKALPEEYENRYYTTLSTSITSQANAQGMTLQQYMSYYYGAGADYTAALKENAKKTAEQYMMFQAIADVEKITVSEQELNDEINNRVETFGYESVEKFKETTDVETFREMMMANKVMDFLIENAQITEK